MKLINKIKKWIYNPINYHKYMKLDLNVNDLNSIEYKKIKEEFEILLKTNKLYISEEDKLKHLCKEINVFEQCFPNFYCKDKIILNKCSSSSEYYQKCLNYYFEHLNDLKGKYFYFFSPYIRHLIHSKVSDKQIIRYLNGDIKFKDIKTYYDELTELNNNYSNDIFNYQIGQDSWGNPIYDEMLFSNKNISN